MTLFFSFGNNAMETGKPIKGQEAIKDCIYKLGFVQCKVNVSVVHAQFALQRSVLIVAKGTFTKNKSQAQHFTHTFLLASQDPNGFYVSNEILLFSRDLPSSMDLAPVVQSGSQTTNVPAEVQNNQTTPVPQSEEIVEEIPDYDYSGPQGEETEDAQGDETSAQTESVATSALDISQNGAKKEVKPFSWAAMAAGETSNKIATPAATKVVKPNSNIGQKTATTKSAPNTAASRTASTASRPRKSATEQSSICVLNLPYDFEESALRVIFEKYGDIKEIVLKQGFAFIEYTTSASATAAVGGEPVVIGDRNVKVEIKKQRKQRSSDRGRKRGRRGRK
eukprot:TRINITY_DN4375_c0_g2_i2.p1 TRINITY_DN4375_c0_g2~~TRINITY_DN4375_c0_g2_i2.p1  ORF type:complete len:388 (+),score=61.59 TRINITY_DN4375_c0_g2_i2:158-1165(+)